MRKNETVKYLDKNKKYFKYLKKIVIEI